MELFIQKIDDSIISKEVKGAMLKAKSFNRVLVQAVEGTGVGSYITNEYVSALSAMTLEKVIEKMTDEGISLRIENGQFKFHHKEEVEFEMSQTDIVYCLLDIITP